MSISEIVVLRIRNVVFSARRVQRIYALVSNRFVSRVPSRKIGSLEYITRKETRLTLDSADRHATPTFVTVLYLRCATVEVRPLLWLIIVLVVVTKGLNLRICLHVFQKLVPDVFDVVTVHA